jgi:hypothetical protein
MRAALVIAVLVACGCTRRPAPEARKTDPAPAVLAGPAGPDAEGGHRLRTLASGPTQICALYTSGSVACWGETARPTLGVTGSADVPVRIPDVRGALEVAVGSCHGCALGKDGRVACWGYKLPATGAREPGLVPAARACDETRAPFAPHPVAVAAHEMPRLRALASSVEPHSTWTAGITEDDRRFAFGAWLSPESGKVVMTAVAPRADETGIHAPGALKGAVALTSGAAPCARYADGHARCWTEELAPGGLAAASLEAPSEPVLDIAQGALDDERCFALASGKVQCRWMRGVVEVPDLVGARSLALSNAELCALRGDGTVACFDYAPGRATPRPRALRAIRAIAAGGDRICALGEGDSVRCWRNADVEPRTVAMP